MIDLRPKVLDYVKSYGPVLPVQVSKAINSNILFSSAVLSELVSNSDVIMSIAKIGGSSLYYVKGQEAKLQKLRDYLGEMPKRAYDLLKENMLLNDKKLEPYQRVALKELKDFAVPITVKYNDNELMFWKWYLATEDIVNELVRKELGIRPVAPKEELVQESKEQSQEEKKDDDICEKKEVASKKTEFKERRERHTKEKGNTTLANNIALEYFKKNDMSIVTMEIVKKNKEIAYVIDMPSKIGNLSYLAYFKDKKKISEDDLIIAHHKGQQYKMPVLFLSNGEIQKSAEEYARKEMKGLLIFKKI